MAEHNYMVIQQAEEWLRGMFLEGRSGEIYSSLDPYGNSPHLREVIGYVSKAGLVESELTDSGLVKHVLTAEGRKKFGLEN